MILLRCAKPPARVFTARGTHEWPPELVVPESWREPYARTVSETDADLPPDVDQAAQRVQALIARVEASQSGVPN
jgi:hypothetical protein